MAQRSVITNARIFDGTRLLDPAPVVIDGDRIGTDPTGARVIDGQGATLLPGLIDDHAHVRTEEQLAQSRSWGLTTVLDMASPDPAAVDALRHRPGLPDLRSALAPATGPDSRQRRMGYGPEIVITAPDQAAGFVAARVREGADYLKIILEAPGTESALDGPSVAALVRVAHEHGLRTIAHATTVAAVRLAVDSGVDVITHAPVEAVLDAELARRMAELGRAGVPTLTMMRAIIDRFGGQPGSTRDYANSRDSVTVLHAAGVPIIAGTDANQGSGGPAPVPHGASLHEELALLVEAGLTPTEALTAATTTPARVFGLTDRGTIAAGNRADLVLVAGDPATDIAATRNIRAVWTAGVEWRP